MIGIFSTAFRTIRQRKLRSALSVLGVVCGVTAVLAMICIGEGAKQEALRHIEQLGIKNIIVREKRLTFAQKAKSISNRSIGLRISDAEKIRKGLPEIDCVSVFKTVDASILGMNREITSQIAATDPDFILTQKFSVSRGRFLSYQDIDQKNLVAVIGHKLAEDLGAAGNPGEYLRVENTEFKIVGIICSEDLKTKKSRVISSRDYSQAVLIPSGTEFHVIDLPNQQAVMDNYKVDELIIKVKSTDQVLKAAGIIRRIMDIAHHAVDDYSLIIPQELLRKSKEEQRTFNIVLGSIAGISLLVGGIGIMNIMLASIYERRREIGIRRAVGANRQHVLIQFLSEAVILTLIGGVFGLLTGIAFVTGISRLSDWETAIVPWSLFLSLGMAFVVGIFSGLYPAVQASRTDPIEVLRTA